MKKIILLAIVLPAMTFAGCMSASETASNTSANSNRTSNSSNNGTSSQSNAPIPTNMGNRAADTKMSNTMSGNVAMNVNKTPSATPVPTAEKKDDGLFSFPPPRVTSYSIVERAALTGGAAQASFSQVSKKLAGGLEKAGYTGGKYSYFWSDKDEFAIVTAMERVNADGAPFEGADRWNESAEPKLPKARSGEYLKYLVSGKKVYYRVFAFVVTAKRSGQSFKRNTPPDFAMALNWMNKGDEQLGGEESSIIEDVVFGEKYKCYALLYLFVNHTSLDAPKSIDALKPDEEGLMEGLNHEAGAHLLQTGVKFGG